MDGQSWTRDPRDRDPRFDARAREDLASDGALADSVEGRLRQLETILSELLSGGAGDRFRVTIWEKNPTSRVRNPHLDAIVINDDFAAARRRIN